MTRRWPDINVTPGSLSSERLPVTMNPRRFLLRPDSLAEKFAVAGKRLGAADVKLARDSRDARPWARLFQSEPAYLYAEILSFKAADAGFAFAEALERRPEDAQRQLLALARELERRRPDLLTAAWWKEERGERVFVDFNQNAPHKTVFGAWSVRAHPIAPVSFPITWAEVPEGSTLQVVLIGGDGRAAI